MFIIAAFSQQRSIDREINMLHRRIKTLKIFHHQQNIHHSTSVFDLQKYVSRERCCENLKYFCHCLVLTFENHEAAEVEEVRNESDFPIHFETCNNTTKLNTAERGDELKCFEASNTRYPSNHTSNLSRARAAKYGVYTCSGAILNSATLFLPKGKEREVALSSTISNP